MGELLTEQSYMSCRTMNVNRIVYSHAREPEREQGKDSFDGGHGNLPVGGH
jgi:hypothetical protein